jgi:hypothetical protein
MAPQSRHADAPADMSERTVQCELQGTWVEARLDRRIN